MNHIPKFLISNKNKNKNRMSRAPKLQRRLALKKNIDYSPPPSSSPPSDPATCHSLRTRSLDLTSFRIQGLEDGEFESICQTLGLSGPDDFAIPAAAWEARKARSVSDLLPRLRHLEEERERETETEESPGKDSVLDLSIRFKDSVRVCDEAIGTDCDTIVDPFDRCVENTSSNIPLLINANTGSNIPLLINENTGSNWDISGDPTNRCRSSVENTRLDVPLLINENTGSNWDISSDPTNRCRSSVENTRSNVPLSIIENTGSNWDISSDPINQCSTSVENTRLDVPLSINEITGSNWDISSDPTNYSSTSKSVIKGGMSSIIETTSSNWDIISNDSNDGGNLNKYGFVGGSIRGIKGVRPPLLAPPPSIVVRVIDDTSSTWDIMRSFAPDSEKTRSFARGMGSYSDDEEDREVRPRGNAAFLSESCSFTTTSNDDDSSSTTTEPMSNISPNGRFKRVITYWEKGDLLGRGSFGSVYEGIADGGYFIAVKEVSLLDQGDMGRQSIYQLEQEIALLSQFEHENIVQYYGTDKDEAHLYIFLELVTKGSLLSLYQKYHLRDSQVSSYTRQILHGLKYLHERNVVHRDIKCANILVGADGSVKLADFGLAKATKLNDVKSCKGTAFWMAPEVVRGRHQGYGLPADIWSLGCTVLEMLTHRIPYSPLECMQALFRIGRGEPPPIPDSLSKDARDFISRCLKVDPNDRPTASQLLDHSFVRRQLSASPGSSSPYHSIGRGLNLS